MKQPFVIPTLALVSVLLLSALPVNAEALYASVTRDSLSC